MVADDGAGYQLRKKGDISAQLDDVGLRLHLTPIYVHKVGDALEGVERDADGQHYVTKGYMRDAEHAAQNIEIVQLTCGWM